MEQALHVGVVVVSATFFHHLDVATIMLVRRCQIRPPVAHTRPPVLRGFIESFQIQGSLADAQAWLLAEVQQVWALRRCRRQIL